MTKTTTKSVNVHTKKTAVADKKANKATTEKKPENIYGYTLDEILKLQRRNRLLERKAREINAAGLKVYEDVLRAFENYRDKFRFITKTKD